MKANNGIGLAANQVGSDKSVFIMAIPFKEMVLERVFVNPQIMLSGQDIAIEEGCLSFPGVTVEVERFETCEISYCDMLGNKKEETFKGLPSIVIQHEFDHLLGKTFIDHLPDLTKQEILSKLKPK
jgi:peptide deformylase